MAPFLPVVPPFLQVGAWAAVAATLWKLWKGVEVVTVIAEAAKSVVRTASASAEELMITFTTVAETTMRDLATESGIWIHYLSRGALLALCLVVVYETVSLFRSWVPKRKFIWPSPFAQPQREGPQQVDSDSPARLTPELAELSRRLAEQHRAHGEAPRAPQPVPPAEGTPSRVQALAVAHAKYPPHRPPRPREPIGAPPHRQRARSLSPEGQIYGLCTVCRSPEHTAEFHRVTLFNPPPRS